MLCSTLKVHNQTEALHNTVNSILDRHCPLIPTKVREDSPPWMTPTIIKLVQAREKAHKKGCKTWKVLRALVRQRKIISSKRKFVNESLNQNADTKIWVSTVKCLTNKNEFNTQSYIDQN